MDPDWHILLEPPNHHHIDHLDELENLRTNDPVLWLIITGARTSVWIAKRLAWPHETVLTHLRQYKAEGYLFDYEGPRNILWATCPGIYEDLLAWLEERRRKGDWCDPHEEQE